MVRISQLTNLLGTRKPVVNPKRIRLDRLMVPIHLIQMGQIKEHQIMLVDLLMLISVFRLKKQLLNWEEVEITITLGIGGQVLQTLLVNRLQKLLVVLLLKLPSIN